MNSKPTIEDFYKLGTNNLFVALFCSIIKDNDYYDNLREYMKLHNKSLIDFATELNNCYDDYDFASIYKFLDVIENFLGDYDDCFQLENVSDILDKITDYNEEYRWD